MKMLSTTKHILTALTLSLVTSVSSSGVELHKKLSVETDAVTLGDIFTDTGELSETVIMPAPSPGKRQQITSFELNRIAEKYKLEWDRPAYLKRVYVHREGTLLTTKDLEPIILDKVRELGVEAELDVKVYGLKKGFYVPLGHDVFSVEFETFNLTDRQDRFTGTLSVPVSEHENTILRVTGTIQEVRLVPVLNRLVTPGEVISETDISWKRHPAQRINTNAITDANAIVGQTVRRAMTPNKLLLKNEITMPVMIAKGSPVSITLKSGLMTLTLKGRALDNGGQGDVIRVMNTKSSRSFEARVISPGKVEVSPRPIIKVASR